MTVPPTDIKRSFSFRRRAPTLDHNTTQPSVISYYIHNQHGHHIVNRTQLRKQQQPTSLKPSPAKKSQPTPEPSRVSLPYQVVGELLNKLFPQSLGSTFCHFYFSYTHWQHVVPFFACLPFTSPTMPGMRGAAGGR